MGLLRSFVEVITAFRLSVLLSIDNGKTDKSPETNKDLGEQYDIRYGRIHTYPALTLERHRITKVYILGTFLGKSYA